MFDRLSGQLISSLKNLTGKGSITEKNIQDAIREIRLSLLDADVNFKVVKRFIEKVKTKALGTQIVEKLSAGQQFFNIVHDELVELLGKEAVPLQFKGKPGVIFLTGLQGMGKTTSAAKLAWFLRKKIKKKPGLVSVDVYRPAARKQLEILAKKNDLPVYSSPSSSQAQPDQILKEALDWSLKEMVEVLLVDTAGRSQIDKELMEELERLKEIGHPKEVLLVIDAMLGQEAVNVAQGFQAVIEVTGICLTKVEGDARGGGALSLREATGLPIKFFGVGEKVTALEVFHPHRLVSRILDQGDILSLVEQAKEVLSDKEIKDSAKKIKKQGFTMGDLLKQIRMMKKMGGMTNVLGMLPGMKQKMSQFSIPEGEMKKMEAIVCSMTPQERSNSKVLNASRRLRIARGSGTQVQDVNRLVKQFEETKKMMSRLMNQRKPFSSLFS